METSSFFGLNYVRALMVLVLLAIVAALGAYTHFALTQARYMNAGPMNITVQGEGEVMARPDIGQFSFSVYAKGDDAAGAQEQSASAINEIIDYLRGAGVDEKDIKTQNYSLNPHYRYEERVCVANSYCPPGEAVIDGYEVSQMVLVKVRELDNAGDLISGVGERGATNISSLQFTIDDESALTAEAREKAIADAKAKAEKLANDLGVRIVRMTGYWENQNGYPQAYGYGGDMAMSESSSVKRTTPSLPTGEDTVSAMVNVSYEVR